MERYRNESMMLSYLARRQLNLEKNRIKPDFEEMNINSILVKLSEELKELVDELNLKPLDFNKTFAELGDVAACLVGLIAWLNNTFKNYD